MYKVKGILLIITVLSMLLFPISTQASCQLGQYTPLGINSLDKMKSNGEFSVYISRNTDWQKIGKITFDKFFREKKMDLSSYISGTETVKIRLLQEGGGAAHIDSIFLGGILPAEVKSVQDSSFALKKLSQKDYDVMDAYGKNIEVIFSAKGKDKILKLTARVEGERISNVPFQFPPRNLFRKMNEHSGFYTYTIGTKDNSGNPFFKEYSHTGSGHPSGFTYGWVSNDDKNLYIRIDFTPDNTMDGDKDYAKVYVKTGRGLKEFKVSVPEKKWGKPDFIYTDKVTYQHKVYDFRIPFTELGIQNMKDRNNLLLAFAAYGTAAPGDYASDLAYDPANNRHLAVFTRASSSDFDVYGQLINCDGTPAGPEFIIFDSDTYVWGPRVAYNIDNHRFLVVWDYNDDIYGQLVNVNGSLYGSNITVSDAANSQEDPNVTYDNVNNKFLIVWIDRRNYGDTYTDVYGQLVNANGSLSGSNFVICDNDDFQHSSSVAFDSTYQRFLVSWEDLRSGPGINRDIYGQLVNANGSLNGSNFVISDAINAQISPEAVFDKANNRFLVMWQDDRTSSVYSDIYGQFVGASGSLDGSNFVIADAPASEYGYPQIAYNSNFENFLVLYSTHEGTLFDFALSLIGPSCQEEINVPTLTEWGMIIFMGLAGLVGVYYLRRQGRAEG